MNAGSSFSVSCLVTSPKHASDVTDASPVTIRQRTRELTSRDAISGHLTVAGTFRAVGCSLSHRGTGHVTGHVMWRSVSLWQWSLPHPVSWPVVTEWSAQHACHLHAQWTVWPVVKDRSCRHQSWWFINHQVTRSAIWRSPWFLSIDFFLRNAYCPSLLFLNSMTNFVPCILRPCPPTLPKWKRSSLWILLAMSYLYYILAMPYTNNTVHKYISEHLSKKVPVKTHLKKHGITEDSVDILSSTTRE